MAEAKPQAGESDSMEDILQSIKRIIEDDTGTEAKPAAPNVLDLTQVVKEDGSVTAIDPIPTHPLKAAASVPSEDVVASIDAMFAGDKSAIEESLPNKAFEAPSFASPKPTIMENGLVSDEAALAAADALKAIAQSAQKDFSVPLIPSASFRQGNTVEDLVLESLRPMLKSWLDEHLPLIVQKIVEKEVQRIVKFHHD
jgi:cell pole-organizing protein PopZ